MVFREGQVFTGCLFAQRNEHGVLSCASQYLSLQTTISVHEECLTRARWAVFLSLFRVSHKRRPTQMSESSEHRRAFLRALGTAGGAIALGATTDRADAQPDVSPFSVHPPVSHHAETVDILRQISASDRACALVKGYHESGDGGGGAFLLRRRR
jgi:hypothetical protein